MEYIMFAGGVCERAIFTAQHVKDVRVKRWQFCFTLTLSHIVILCLQLET